MKPLVFLHGWAQSRQAWFGQFDVFSEASFLNLPGHGGADDANAAHWLDRLAEQLPEEPAVLVGWSLGGMLAMQLAARYPERIAALALVGTTPRFRAGDGWEYGSSEPVFEGFREAVQSGSARALNRFFALMLHGDNLARSDYNQLAKAAVDRDKRVSEAGLSAGLDLLEQLDLRELAAEVRQPVLVMHGYDDAIVSSDAGAWLADAMSGADLRLLEACGHAPFMTQAEWFNKTLSEWWQQQ